MPAKSRRNRRNIPQSNKFAGNPADSSVAPRESAVQPERVATPRSIGGSRSTAAISSYPYILGEIKWIGLVTVIVAVLLVILYIFLH